MANDIEIMPRDLANFDRLDARADKTAYRLDTASERWRKAADVIADGALVRQMMSVHHMNEDEARGHVKHLAEGMRDVATAMRDASERSARVMELLESATVRVDDARRRAGLRPAEHIETGV